MIRYLRQLIAYLAFAAFVVVFAQWPDYRILLPQEAMVSLSLSHAGARVGECRTLSQGELNELPPNMRKPSECPRERHPVLIRLLANDELLVEETLLPSGIWSDGKANVYRRIKVPSGDYRFQVAMNDSGSEHKYDIQQSSNISIAPGQNLVISFDELHKSFTFE